MEEKMSLFNVGRILTEEEYRELRAWIEENPSKRWRERDVHPETGKLFLSYSKKAKNGEGWTTQARIDNKRRSDNKYLEENRDRVNKMTLARSYRYRKANPQKFIERTRNYRKNRTEEQKEKSRKSSRKYFKERRANDPVFRASQDVRTMIRGALGNKNFKKTEKTESILGLSFSEFKEYLESLFEPWMNWENRGGVGITTEKTNWDIDHIVPLSSAETEEDVIRLCHYSNLRPMCSHINRNVKKDQLDWQNG